MALVGQALSLERHSGAADSHSIDSGAKTTCVNQIRTFEILVAIGPPQAQIHQSDVTLSVLSYRYGCFLDGPFHLCISDLYDVYKQEYFFYHFS